MSFTVTPITPDRLISDWKGLQEQGLIAPHPFVLPYWLKAWWANFSDGNELQLKVICDETGALGVSPLRRRGNKAFFIGSPNVCDYIDFVVKPGSESAFFSEILDNLISSGVEHLELEALRSDSMVLRYLVPLARARLFKVEIEDTDVTLEMPLAETWDTYLRELDAHQRHEIRRKGRRLKESGDVQFNIKTPDDVNINLEILIRLLKISREDKAEFMTENMERFFSDVAGAMYEAGLLRFGHLSVDGETVASVMCFDYNGVRYLYNSGYSPEKSNLSVGLLSKVYSIEDAIEQQLKKYDFLKGAEIYKYHLGGREIPVSRCRIGLSR